MRKEIHEDIDSEQHRKFLVETKSLKLDSLATWEFYWVQYVEGEGEEEDLIVLNKVFNSLDIYDLDNQVLKKRIRLGTDDKFGKFAASGFYFHNSDSIFIYPSYTLDGTLIINSKGDVVRKVKTNIPEESENVHALNHVSSPSSPSVYYGGKVHASVASMMSSSWDSGLSADYKTNITLDLITEEIFFVPHLNYPKEYIGKATTNHHSFLCRAFVEGRYWVHSYPLLDSVYLYDTNYKYLGSKYAGSSFFEGFVELEKGTPHNEQFIYIIENSSYARVIYDKYRKLFYRVTLIGRKLDTSIDESSMDNSRNQFSIVVFDENFQKIKEVLFPSKKYYHYAAFVGKNGLYLPKINKDYINISEDTVSYDIFSFVGE
ncbi:DUF4221 family protein [Algoriphagus persicinus]|uniref:DUF4221 family protein n=1 Tax=Algoriphagus persicinus TaxID=3108754 RepID=UPI002B38F36D|nr:DUF4221 family protein [Algoriphagus sp. E1-3-M2]MEB2785527.1 DUF4221 family protein [Algoriphagus sp. E1-3-M2]